MTYKVASFSASMSAKDTASNPVTQLQGLINEQAKDGWEYVALEDVSFDLHTPGTAGCFGIGATQGFTETKRTYLVVFRK